AEAEQLPSRHGNGLWLPFGPEVAHTSCNGLSVVSGAEFPDLHPADCDDTLVAKDFIKPTTSLRSNHPHLLHRVLHLCLCRSEHKTKVVPSQSSGQSAAIIRGL